MDKLIIDNYGAENLDKVKRNMVDGTKEARKRFLATYPYADTSKFEFVVDLKKNGDINKYVTYYKINDNESYDIASDTFLNNRFWTKNLYWKTLWGGRGTVRQFSKNPVGTQYKINSLKIYVDNDKFFDANLADFSIVEGTENGYEDNTYLASLFAAYITTYTCGISTQHFEYNNKTPKIITSIARYHLYYHMRRFIRQPTKMTKYVTQEMKRIIERNRPVDYEWTKEFHQGRENVGYWVSKQPRGTIRNAKNRLKGNFGHIGIDYEKRGKRIVKTHEDYKTFIAKWSTGLTKTGQLLLQQSIESYVYCILGAQAKTRWPIVGRGAMSLQTQEILVADTIIQDDQTAATVNMRTAIKDTNVVLNMAISPGVILMPFNMIILTEMVAGYNNILKIAGSGMRFGENSGINYYGTDSEATTTHNTGSEMQTEVVKKPQTKTVKPQTKAVGEIISGRPNTSQSGLYLLITTVICGSLVSKFVI